MPVLVWVGLGAVAGAYAVDAFGDAREAVCTTSEAAIKLAVGVAAVAGAVYVVKRVL